MRYVVFNIFICFNSLGLGYIETSYLFTTDDNAYYDNVDLDQISIYDNSGTINVDIYGGHINSIGSNDTSVINIYGGTTGNVMTCDSSTINIFQGQGRVLSAYDYATINLYGGDYIFLGAPEFSTVNIYGYNLSYTLFDVPIGGSVGLAVDGYIHGFWADSTPFTLEIGNWRGDVPLENPATFDHIVLHEIPEPATVFLLAIGFLTIKSRRS